VTRSFYRSASLTTLLLALYAFSGGGTGIAAAQTRSGVRRFATTVTEVVAYPAFYHAQLVRVRGALQQTPDNQLSIADGDASVLVIGQAAAGLTPDSSADQEVVGTLFDVGRLGEHDPRLAGLNVEELSRKRSGKPWPAANELLVIAAESIDRAAPFPAPSIRALALAPGRYVGTQVTVTGRFRGRNLYGDQPGTPGRSRVDFLLQSADASVWVVGLRPQGPGFNFSVESRQDVDRWLEVSGVVRREQTFVVLDGVSVRLAPAPVGAQESEPVARVRTVGPAPEIVFSAPVNDETDVSRNTRIRIQFSQDLDPTSIDGQIRVAYVNDAKADADGKPSELSFIADYEPGVRVLEIRFRGPLDGYRTVRVELLPGIKATDGAPLTPWTLSFTSGG
jgi:hypothetical protein